MVSSIAETLAKAQAAGKSSADIAAAAKAAGVSVPSGSSSVTTPKATTTVSTPSTPSSQTKTWTPPIPAPTKTTTTPSTTVDPNKAPAGFTPEQQKVMNDVSAQAKAAGKSEADIAAAAAAALAAYNKNPTTTTKPTTTNTITPAVNQATIDMVKNAQALGKTNAEIQAALTKAGYGSIDSILGTKVEQPQVVNPNAGKYKDANGNMVDILGYNDLPDDVKALVDGMTDAEKKLLDMQRGNDVNAKAEYVRQAKRSQEFLTEQRAKTIQINDINGNVLDIQSSQRLQDAGQQVANLIQQVAYLGDKGQPGISGARMQAAQRMIADAENKYAQMKSIETSVSQIRELGLEMDTAAFEKQMADIADDLNMKVGQQIQNALNQYTSADLAGQLDTIDGVTQFKRSLLQKLDANISGYTEGSMKQMQYVTQTYQDIADKAEARLTEWTKNSNTINTEMSTAKGYYVDGNGTPLYSSSGATIPMPEKPPLEPNYDKDTGRLVTFSTDANGQIVASVQQVTNQATIAQQSAQSFAQLIVNGQMTMADVPTDLKASVASAMVNMKPQSTTNTGYQGPEIAPVSNDKVQSTLQQVEASAPDGTIGGQCGEFVNNYLQDMGLGRLFIDPIDAKKAIKNSDTPTVGSVAIFDWSNNPNATLAQQKYGHVGIVTAINGNQITVKQSNNNGNETVFTSTYDKNKAFGYFDPSKGLKPQAASNNIQEKIATDDNYKLANEIASGNGSLSKVPAAQYKKVVNALGEIVDSKINSTDDPQLKKIYESAKYDKEVSDTTSIKLTDAFTVLTQVSDLTTQLEDMKKDVGPIEGMLRSKNPYDVNAQTLATRLNSLVPKVARGVFGEVGVLTDQDIERYMKTLPNGKMPKDVSDIVGQLLKITVTKSIINTITTQAKSQRNVNNYADDYEYAKQYLNSLGISANPWDSYKGGDTTQGGTVRR